MVSEKCGGGERGYASWSLCCFIFSLSRVSLWRRGSGRTCHGRNEGSDVRRKLLVSNMDVDVVVVVSIGNPNRIARRVRDVHPLDVGIVRPVEEARAVVAGFGGGRARIGGGSGRGCRRWYDAGGAEERALTMATSGGAFRSTSKAGRSGSLYSRLIHARAKDGGLTGPA